MFYLNMSEFYKIQRILHKYNAILLVTSHSSVIVKINVRSTLSHFISKMSNIDVDY